MTSTQPVSKVFVLKVTRASKLQLCSTFPKCPMNMTHFKTSIALFIGKVIGGETFSNITQSTSTFRMLATNCTEFYNPNLSQHPDLAVDTFTLMFSYDDTYQTSAPSTSRIDSKVELFSRWINLKLLKDPVKLWKEIMTGKLQSVILITSSLLRKVFKNQNCVQESMKTLFLPEFHISANCASNHGETHNSTPDQHSHVEKIELRV